ncbi:hypothetical protein EDC01DRAFT_675013 [Geopyxis carbonaria]|nr:hypothetical protein EDC01DRAFT_675013 [Geopyxis carbonaria]
MKRTTTLHELSSACTYLYVFFFFFYHCRSWRVAFGGGGAAKTTTRKCVYFHFFLFPGLLLVRLFFRPPLPPLQLHCTLQPISSSSFSLHAQFLYKFLLGVSFHFHPFPSISLSISISFFLFSSFFFFSVMCFINSPGRASGRC